jgi:flagellar basal body rod protein FlgC
MSLTTVAELRTALGVGTLYADATLQEVCDAADNVLLPFLWTNTNSNVGHSNTTNTGTLYFDFPVQDTYYVGQTVVITGNGSKHNGSKTLTGVGTDSITYAITGNNNTAAPYHPVNPFGSVAADTYVDYTTVPAIQEAALMISIDIWQSRQAPSSGGVTIDGFAPSPYRMGNTLLARVRGLLAPYLDPRSMVG